MGTAGDQALDIGSAAPMTPRMKLPCRVIWILVYNSDPGWTQIRIILAVS